MSQQSETPKADALFEFMLTLSIDENRQLIQYARRLQKAGLRVPTLAMSKDFIEVYRLEHRTPQHLQGDGFDFIQAH